MHSSELFNQFIQQDPDPASWRPALIRIYPLAPLSMVTSMPGKYYHTVQIPDKLQVCGLFENILGLRVGDDERKAMRKQIEKMYAKRFKHYDAALLHQQSASGYLPLLHHLFDLDTEGLKMLPATIQYEDYWKQQMKASDSRHLGGIVNMDWSLVEQVGKLAESSQKEKDDFAKRHLDRLPMYYTTPTKREYIDCQGAYILKMHIQPALFDALSRCIEEEADSAYLGHSESWVYITIEAL